MKQRTSRTDSQYFSQRRFPGKGSRHWPNTEFSKCVFGTKFHPDFVDRRMFRAVPISTKSFVTRFSIEKSHQTAWFSCQRTCQLPTDRLSPYLHCLESVVTTRTVASNPPIDVYTFEMDSFFWRAQLRSLGMSLSEHLGSDRDLDGRILARVSV